MARACKENGKENQHNVDILDEDGKIVVVGVWCCSFVCFAWNAIVANCPLIIFYLEYTNWRLSINNQLISLCAGVL